MFIYFLSVTVQFGVVNNQRNLRGVTISSSLLNFGMFARSTILISRFSHFMSKTGAFG